MTDGKIIHPDTPPDALVRSVRFFDAGFAAEVASSGGLPAVQLFDDAGRKTADVGGNQVVGTTANLTAVFDDDRWGIYAPPDGARLLDLPREQAGGIQLIGSTLWVTKSGGAVHHSQPYDLRTGDPGKPCDIDFGGYLAATGPWPCERRSIRSPMTWRRRTISPRVVSPGRYHDRGLPRQTGQDR